MSSTTSSLAAERSDSASPSDLQRTAFGTTDMWLIVMSVIWGVNFSVVKSALAVMPALTFTGLRVAIAATVLWGISATVRNAPLPSRRDVVALLGLGIIGNGFYQCLFIIGMSHTRAGIAALVIAASPAWIAIISQFLGREQLSSRGWIGIGLQLTGVACVVASTGAMEASGEAILGAGLIAIGSIMWAVFSVLLQPYTQRTHAIHLSAITLSSGGLFCLIFALPGMLRMDWSTVTLPAWGAVLYASVGALVIAYLLFYRGIRVLGPTRTAMYSNLQPIIALAVAAMVLSERPTGWQLLGATLIMAGLLISRTAKVAPTRPLTPISDRL